MGGYTTACGWRSEDSLWELVLSFLYVAPRSQTQVARLGSTFTQEAFLPVQHACLTALNTVF